MVNIKINGIEYAVEEGTTILEACRQNGIRIPTLCWLKDINAIGACRICVVEMTGARSLVASCVYPLSKFDEGKNILTHSPAVLQSRKMTLHLLLSDHNMDCLACSRNGSCELQELCKELGVDDTTFFEGEKNEYDIDYSSKHMFRDNNKCIHCRRCIAACDKLQGIGVIGANNRGFKTSIDCAFDLDLAETACVSCGQCITACPTGALAEKDDTDKVWDALADPEKVVVVQTAPAVRASLGEAFGYPMGTPVEGKMVAALRRLGFNAVFDTNFGADLTIMEESHEFLDRVTNGGVLPMITSCSPGWIRFCEAYFPEFIPNLSSCKSPQQMNGAITKTYWAKKMGIDPKNIVSVSVMPCTAKKFEIGREDQSAAGVPDVDISITTRELVKMINRAGLRFRDLPDEVADSPLGNGTGAAVIFGATGGVMEAALRTAVWKLTGEAADSPVEFKDVRGVEGIKTAEYKVGDLTVKVAVVSGLANAKKFLTQVKNGEVECHFIEIMACPGGCVNGGGQVIQPADVRNFTDIRAERAKALYSLDDANKLRKSHESPDVKEVYENFLGEPGSHIAHEILHTSYKASHLSK
ncbi:hydrogenases, Fe-only [[Eubacterium] siraeum 70/3]|uniref:Hydrogenases, Fe-only n=1 Tax=[Eubacterium] siraeum 70/3 TaxID=657319 RepID=D4JT97_9FIRM|nr:hydrogenases, Fe-only [[Eubacterium] siraeum 70/3]